MSIRKRLFLSNFAMIVMPIIIILLIIFLFNIVINGGFKGNHFKQRWQSTEAPTSEVFNDLKKAASLEQEKLSDGDYMSTLTNNQDFNIAIRKGESFIYTTDHLKNISNEDLPSFGNEGYDPAGARFGQEHYSIRQHDFYFNDGTEGSIFLLDHAASFVKFARTFFPIIFISLIVVLILTNVLLSYFMSRGILLPVKQLSDASEKVSKGNLDFSVQSKSKDELGQLVQSFDTMRAQLKESLALRDKYENNRRELIANISHDLKTPVTSILGYVEGIQDGVANSVAKQERYLETIHTKATYMNRLIEELSLYSNLDVKKLPFYFESVNIHAFVQDYLDEIASELAEKKIQLKLDTKDFQKRVILDRDKLIRVMENLIFNSVKYMDKSTGRITVLLTDQEQVVKVTIMDNGPGVSEEEVSTIFNRFYRTDPSRSTQGSGLGLAIASQIIEAHGGSIWAENLPDKGLAIHFTLKKSEGDNHE